MGVNMPGQSILVIDDEDFILRSLQRLLSDHYEVITCLGGEAGMDRIVTNEGNVDIILCDICMPKVNGADIYYAMSTKYPGLEKRIIFMTGGAYTDTLGKFTSNLTNICLSKPFNKEELLAAIDQHQSAG